MSKPPSAVPDLILASGSRYRAELLARLRLPFRAEASSVDETADSAESPADLALRLARAKAEALSAQSPRAWIIGSDQTAAIGSRIIGKPGTSDAAIAQLKAASGTTVTFNTAVVLRTPDRHFDAMDTTTVRFRLLSDTQIERYVEAESPLDCAGSFKCEGLGISLFESIDSHDPTALVGLPLIALCRLLRQAGLELP